MKMETNDYLLFDDHVNGKEAAPKLDKITIIQLNNATLLEQQKTICQTNISNNQIQPSNVSPVEDKKLDKKELSRIKEIARRQRNRQSAMISRQKKVEHMKNIEKSLEESKNENQHLKIENHNLKKENQTLRDLVNKLSFENNQLQNIRSDYLKYPLDMSSSSTKNNYLFNSTDTNKTKKTISLLAVIFLIGLNMNLYNDNFKTYDSTTKKLSKNAFKGRVLLWSDDLESPVNTSMMNASNINCNHQKLLSQNETLILESKLRNWAIHQANKQQLFYSASSSSNNNNKLMDHDVSSNERKLPWYLGIRNWNQIDERKQEQRRLYSTESEDKELNYEQIINSIRPKENTYYFLSLHSDDHLILPLNFYSNATKTKGLFRPKFSLLLPTSNSQFLSNLSSSSLNTTNEFKNSNSFVHLIEINFEVINMKPIQILKNGFNLNSNSRFLNRRIIRGAYDKLIQMNNSSIRSSQKPILLRNQTIVTRANVQSHQSKSNLTK